MCLHQQLVFRSVREPDCALTRVYQGGGRVRGRVRNGFPDRKMRGQGVCPDPARCDREPVWGGG